MEETGVLQITSEEEEGIDEEKNLASTLSPCEVPTLCPCEVPSNCSATAAAMMST